MSLESPNSKNESRLHRFKRWLHPYLMGAATILDFGGTLRKPPIQNDYSAVADDWRKIGEDMRKVMKEKPPESFKPKSN